MIFSSSALASRRDADISEDAAAVKLRNYVSCASVSPLPPCFCFVGLSLHAVVGSKASSRNLVTRHLLGRCMQAKDGEQLKCQRAVSANPAVRVELPGKP
eukprot:671863-Rhodomonas_salina.4